MNIEDVDLEWASLSDLLSAQAKRLGDKPLLWTPNGVVSYREVNDRAWMYAGGLRRAGITSGDRVMLMMDNTADQVVLWMAIERLGAVNVPVNPAIGSQLIARAIATVEPSVIIADQAHAAVLATAERDRAERTPTYINLEALSSLPTSRLGSARPLTDLANAALSWAPAVASSNPGVMLFTSGSTGTPKACVLSRRHLVRTGQLHVKYLGLRADDVLFTPFPLFHIDAATLTVGAAITAGATAALAPRFSASMFWDQVRASGATVFNYMGATANILWKQPAGELDRAHKVRMAWGVPLPACAKDWETRFGFPLKEVYGLTDAGVPAYPPLDAPAVEGSCGRIIPEYEVRIADPDGDSVECGMVGEILIRGREPGLLLMEYLGMPEATSQAMRGGWFHTGDLGCLDSDSNLFFASRAKEVIRRRGENIAATDIEKAVDSHPAVEESAAVGVPSELSDDDIKVFVVLKSKDMITPADVATHCADALPRFMVPRYVEIVEALPKTPTEKIERAKLAARPITEATWDGDSSRRRQETQETHQ